MDPNTSSALADLKENLKRLSEQIKELEAKRLAIEQEILEMRSTIAALEVLLQTQL